MIEVHLLYHAITIVMALASSWLSFRLYKRTESKEALYVSMATFVSALAVSALGLAVTALETQGPFHALLMITYALSSTSFLLYMLAMIELLHKPELKTYAIVFYIVMLALGLIGHHVMKLIGDAIHAVYGIITGAMALYIGKEVYGALKDKRALMLTAGVALYTISFGLTTAFIGTVIADIKLLIATIGLALVAYASR